MKDLNFSPVKLAREVLETYLEEGGFPELPAADIRAGAFVSIKTAAEEELRGCIGTIEPCADSLAEEIAQNAVSAACKDPRFPRLKKEELAGVKISVDVLGDKEAVDDLSQLDPKRYGVIVEKGGNRGVLLPDLEGVDTARRQLNIACQKAGIEPGELEHGGVCIYRFPVKRYEEE